MTNYREGEILKIDGRYRVRLTTDESFSFSPRADYDHIDHVITASSHHYHERIDEDLGPLAGIWNRLITSYDWPEAAEIFQRYCAITHRAVTLHDNPLNASPVAIWYLMAEDLHEVGDPVKYLKAQRDEYRSWAEGDVWGYIVEERQLWHRHLKEDPSLPPVDQRYEWVRTDDSCWGIIGYKWAEQEALNALDGRVKK